MDDKELIKKKNDLLKSIMSNPKLSKTFSEAMSASIGSTKREQAKSILSIMKKMGGIRNDGRGGPAPVQQNSPVDVEMPDYSNMIIFPAAPKLKTQTPIQNNNSEQGGFNDGYGGYDGKGGILDSYKIPEYKPSNISTGLTLPNIGGNNNTGLNIFGSPAGSSSFTGIPTPETFDVNKYGITLPPPTTRMETGMTGSTGKIYSNIPDTIQKTSGTFGTSNALSVGQYGGATIADQATSALSSQPSFIGPIQEKTTTPTGTTTTPVIKTAGDRVIDAARGAVQAGTGAGLFAMGIADEKFGGGLNQYIANLDAKLKKDFNLTPLENELSNLRAQKQNLIPTIQSYIRGKDEYLTFIDKMIDEMESNLLNTDMGNPAVANSYNNHLKYLYTLKGRQNQRYGNFLNAAIDDYNADLERTTSNYENVYNRYNDLINRTTDIATNEYNTLYNTMADLYTNLENAPLRALNIEALTIQNMLNKQEVIEFNIALQATTNPDYPGDLKDTLKKITNSDGGFEYNIIGADGLIELFDEAVYAGQDIGAVARGINIAWANTLAGDIEDPFKELGKFRELVDGLYEEEDGANLAQRILPTLAKNTQELISTHILNNLDYFKRATSELVEGKSGFFTRDKTSGLTDPTRWKEDFSDINSLILDDLYHLATVNVTQGGNSASNFLSELFRGANDQDVADNITYSLMEIW